MCRDKSCIVKQTTHDLVAGSLTAGPRHQLAAAKVHQAKFFGMQSFQWPLKVLEFLHPFRRVTTVPISFERKDAAHERGHGGKIHVYSRLVSHWKECHIVTLSINRTQARQ